ncbi:hypothetical protein HYV43_06460 [Candidatus Micrarchaeota archaeon]|nr:hypothetical protein [Candidatus Micrarchaeota archaeon]
MVDSWKSKSWYNLVSPKFLGEIKIAEIPASDEDHLMNRIIALPLKEVTHDISHMYTTVRLRVEGIKDKNAYTKFIGHSASREYLSTLGRRNRDVLRVVYTGVSKDGVKLTVKMVVVTAVPCSTPQRKAVRNAALAELKRIIAETRFGDFIQGVLYNKINPQIHNLVKKIVPIYRVELYKTELFEVFDETAVIELDRTKKEREAAVAKDAEAEKPAEGAVATETVAAAPATDEKAAEPTPA